ncbi:MAG: cysteine desulfurase [Bacilli bacterium]|nr:cysteine desulfurase [Bacilli bacterium]
MIYFDNASTTKVNKKVLDTYLDANASFFANPNSIHHLGMEVNNKINKEKDKVLSLLKLSSRDYEVIYTSSATEANNLAIIGYCLKNKNKGNHIITTKIEHASVLECFKVLEKEGFEVSYLNVNENGQIDIEEFKKTIKSSTIFASIMPVNNEVGLKLNIKEIKEVIKNYPKCVLHVDAAQTLGKAKFDYSLGDLITISSHKIYGLKSIAALIIKKKINLSPIINGGGQEYNLRSGTQDYPLIVSFTVAIEDILRNFEKNYAKVHLIFEFLTNELSKNPEISLNTYKDQCEYILNFSLLNKKSSVVVEALSNKEIYVSSVSACSSKKEEPSYVLLALNKSLNEAKNSIRLSFGEENTLEEAKIFINELNDILKNIRS